MGKSPLEIIIRFQPMMPNTIASTYGRKSPAAQKLTSEWHEETKITRAYLDKAERRMKKWADLRKRHVEYKEGNRVMVNLLRQQFKTLRKIHKGLMSQYEGPFSSLDFITHLIFGLGRAYYPVVVYINANVLKMSVNEGKPYFGPQLLLVEIVKVLTKHT